MQHTIRMDEDPLLSSLVSDISVPAQGHQCSCSSLLVQGPRRFQSSHLVLVSSPSPTTFPCLATGRPVCSPYGIS